MYPFDDLDHLDPALRRSVLYELGELYTQTEPLVTSVPERPPTLPSSYGHVPLLSPPQEDVVPLTSNPPDFPRASQSMIVSIVVIGFILFLILSVFSSTGSPQENRQAMPVCPHYTVVCHPTLGADFLNSVLHLYHSPADGKGQELYDLGIQYGIDPAFALAFFMHESTFGTKGEASQSLSLGNIRCIPKYQCRDHFAWFDTWEDGFQEWYKLLQNLYINQWGLTTVDQIIPVYAPTADHNNETAYIGSLKHALDTWHAGKVRVL